MTIKKDNDNQYLLASAATRGANDPLDVLVVTPAMAREMLKREPTIVPDDEPDDPVDLNEHEKSF